MMMKNLLELRAKSVMMMMMMRLAGKLFMKGEIDTVENTEESKWLMTTIFDVAILWKHNAEVLWSSMGFMLNSYLYIVLKKKHTCGVATRRWYMVADTNSLLNKECRRSLQLLYGLKGTLLIITRSQG